MFPRLISTKQAKKVSQAGGVIGVWTHLSDSPLSYGQNIMAMVKVVGIEHVCIGTDTKMAKDIAANKATIKIGETTNLAWPNQTQGFYYDVVKALLEIGFKENEIIKIGGGNFYRVFDQATRK